MIEQLGKLQRLSSRLFAAKILSLASNPRRHCCKPPEAREDDIRVILPKTVQILFKFSSEESPFFGNEKEQDDPADYSRGCPMSRYLAAREPKI
jgi:hypothetical protein